jgi:tRNA U34 5-methylaminomethyl-2-thiouridine-forming methyltransferase MnmC
LPAKIKILVLKADNFVPDMNIPVIISTDDGSDTLFVTEMNEQYHSIHGAVSESRHIFLNCGFNYFSNHPDIKVLEIGFGTGLNCLLTALEAVRSNIYTRYFAMEKYPLPAELVRRLNYPDLTGSEGSEIFSRIHEAPWDEKVMITHRFELVKLRDDFTESSLEGIQGVQVVYFDAFGPEKQPEMWETELFRKLNQVMMEGGLLMTFSAKGSVRRSLQAAGFEVERLPGPRGKREILRAFKMKVKSE